MKPVEERLRHALSADADELWTILRDPHPDVVANATLNRNLNEEMAVFIAKKKSVSADTLGFLAADVRFKSSYPLKLAICRNPKTPQRVVMSLLKFLRIFDLGDLSKDKGIPVAVRQKVEFIVTDKLTALPSGVKIALSRRVNSALIMNLIHRGDEKVVAACLDTPLMTEGILYQVINRAEVKPHVIRLIAEHRKWSLRYTVRLILIRNFHTPMPLVAQFIPAMKSADLRELYGDPDLPTATRPFIFRELKERGEPVKPPRERAYRLAEDADAGLGESS
jgi:hypothetical protein